MNAFDTKSFGLILLFVFFFYSLSTRVHGGEISLSAQIDKTEIPFEATAQLSMEIRWEGKVGDYGFELLPLPTTQNLKILGTSSSVSSDVVNGRDITVRSFRYSLEPTNAGLGLVEPIVLDYVSLPDSIPGQLASQQFQIQINEPLPKKEDKGSGAGYLIFVVPTLLGVFVVALVVRLRRKRHPKEPIISDEETLLEALALAKKEAMSDRKLFFTRLYVILSLYLEHKLSIKTAGRTSSEILNDAGGLNLPEGMKEKIAEWLSQAEREKYVPLPGEPGDMIRLATEIENLFGKK